MTILKSIGAVFAGFVTVAGLSVLTDFILESLGVFPPPSDEGLYVTWMLALAFIYRSVYAIVGGYVAALLAPSKPMRHVAILGILGTLGGIAGAVAGWDLSDHWYPIALAVTALPLVYLGGTLYQKRNRTVV